MAPVRRKALRFVTGEAVMSIGDKLLRRVARALSCCFHLTGSFDKRIPLSQNTTAYRNGGAPRVGFTRGGFGAEAFEATLWTRGSALPHFQLLSSFGATQDDADAKSLCAS